MTLFFSTKVFPELVITGSTQTTQQRAGWFFRGHRANTKPHHYIILKGLSMFDPPTGEH